MLNKFSNKNQLLQEMILELLFNLVLGSSLSKTRKKQFKMLENASKKFELISLFNPDNFHMSGKCKN